MAEKMKTCDICGAEMAANAKTCPSCGGKNKKPIYKKWWFWVLLVVVVAAIAGGSGRSGGGQPSGGDSSKAGSGAGKQQEEPVSYTHYDVTELFDALKKNALSAEKIYNGQYVEIEGYLGTIDSSGKYICVEAAPDNYDYLLDSVQCYIKSEDQTNRVMELAAGDPITVRGKITAVGEVLGYSLDIDSIN